jgi:hypothetical protein
VILTELRRTTARDLFGQSRQIFEHIGAAEAADVAAELTALP